MGVDSLVCDGSWLAFSLALVVRNGTCHVSCRCHSPCLVFLDEVAQDALDCAIAASVALARHSVKARHVKEEIDEQTEKTLVLSISILQLAQLLVHLVTVELNALELVLLHVTEVLQIFHLVLKAYDISLIMPITVATPTLLTLYGCRCFRGILGRHDTQVLSMGRL